MRVHELLNPRLTPVCEDVNMADDKNSSELQNNDEKLHECVFNGDIRRVSALVRSCDVSKKDKHGKV